MTKLAELTEGTSFAGYVVVRKLSQGGMGSVYQVTQTSTGRQRALKLMHAEIADNADLRAKFVREARLGSRIESEHVVEVVDAGVDGASGIPWLAMELLQGEDLAALSQRVGRLEPVDVFTIFDQLSHALGAAHSAGIVHRDLKPDNIFVARSQRAGESITVKVLDFGIAKLVAEARTSANTAAMGTAYWMAPEQTEQAALITPATDVWALGLIAYRLLTGRLFWRAATDANASVTMFLRELVLDPLPAASVRAEQQGVLAFLPAGFDAWFARCVVRDQAARFSDARVAGAALLELRGGSTSLEPSSVLSSGRVVVRTSEPSPRASTEVGLGTARTIAEPRWPSHDDETLHTVPTVRVSRGAIALGTGAVIAALGLLAFAWPRTSSTPPPLATTAPGTAAAVDLRCPKTMIPIAEGTFMMGAADGPEDERPVHSVSLNAFCLDMTEVQVGEYVQCVEAQACVPAPTEVRWKGITPEDKALYGAACNGSKKELYDYPVNCVSWDEAKAYCHWANKRLPSEEEWEFAARGSEARAYPWGNEPPSAQRLNGCGEECARGAMLGDRGLLPLFEGRDGWETTAPTRAFAPGKTRDGLYDMAGNVSEWTSSRDCPYPGTNCNKEWRIARGGAWSSDGRDGVKAARRERNAPDARTADIGFRCAR
jgi:formylglycine-generating enzyme required for sulfatase activity/serine/threonine protein kinase